MKKVYLLLRNNQQRGPFTFDELVKQGLKPTDLVWEEGRSHAWCYPSELPEFKTVADPAIQKPPTVPTSPSAPDEIEKRAEELRQKVLSFAPSYYSPTEWNREKVYVDAYNAYQSEKIELIDHRKRDVPLYEWMSGVAVMLIVVIGVYGGQKYFFSRSTVVSEGTTRTVATDDHAAKVNRRVLPAAPAFVQEILPDSNSLAVPVAEQRLAMRPSKRKTAAPEVRPATTIEKTARKEPNGSDSTSSVADTPLLQEPVKAEAIEPVAIVAIGAVEKKKSGGLFKGLFKKKKRPAAEETKTEEVGSN